MLRTTLIPRYLKVNFAIQHPGDVTAVLNESPPSSLKYSYFFCQQRMLSNAWDSGKLSTLICQVTTSQPIDGIRKTRMLEIYLKIKRTLHTIRNLPHKVCQAAVESATKPKFPTIIG
jgi:hypothetical protein